MLFVWLALPSTALVCLYLEAFSSAPYEYLPPPHPHVIADLSTILFFRNVSHSKLGSLTFYLFWVQVIKDIIDSEGWQNMPHRNMPLHCNDYFDLQALEKQQIKGQTFSELTYLPKHTSSKGTQWS